jgi:hypothetical protein
MTVFIPGGVFDHPILITIETVADTTAETATATINVVAAPAAVETPADDDDAIVIVEEGGRQQDDFDTRREI